MHFSVSNVHSKKSIEHKVNLSDPVVYYYADKKYYC